MLTDRNIIQLFNEWTLKKHVSGLCACWKCNSSSSEVKKETRLVEDGWMQRHPVSYKKPTYLIQA
jgi:hypothetical protein